MRFILLALLAACSSNADPGTARPIGCPGGTVNGTLDHHAFAPVGAACARTEATGDATVGSLYSIVLNSAYDGCPIYGGGDALAISFCGATAPALGSYSSGDGFDCPGDRPVVTVLFGDALSEVVSSAGGTVAITDDDGECISGTFDVPFAQSETVTDHLTGEFHALKPQ
jgi:hypothetical protein